MPRSRFLALKLRLLVLVFVPFVSSFVFAQSPTPTQSTTAVSPLPAAKKLSFAEAFNQGTKDYQEKNYAAAAENFQTALDFEPESAAVLTDLGLSYYQQHKKGLAIGYFRRALFIDPSLPTANAALKFALSELEVKEIPHQIESYERLRSNVLTSISLIGLHLMTALLLFSSGFIWLRFLGRRRKAAELEEAPPAVPTVGVILVLAFVVSLGLTFLKIYDLSKPRATVIADKVGAQIAPGEGQSSLFELYAGFEVLVSNTSPGWTQVQYPGGLTGWVKNDTLMLTSGQNAF